MTLAKKTENAADREIVMTRLIDASVARVWRAWTDNAEIVKWWGPHGFSDETSSREFKEGGIWKHVMIGPDGARYVNTAKYVEIVPEKKIVVKNGGGKEFDEKGVGFVSTITFKAVGGKTELTMRLVFITAAMKKQAVEVFHAVEGGQQTLSRLNAHVAGQFVIFRYVDAPRERVWRAWTSEKELGAWMGPKGAETGYAKMDLRVGGTYHYMNKFNGVEMWGLATYRVIEKPAKLVFVQQFSDKERGLGRHPMSPNWPKQLLTTVHLQEFGAKTLISLYWDPIDPSDVERKTFTDAMPGMNQGWGGSFDRLDAFLKEAA
ncbi:MAG: SRPBCC domain-containing protein [Elusimicrobia bacterium]|nr:SRPBCC domain-containing protein [Elusimicrobiota bacterium]MDE2509597.1 SRPBCC domain-containing protein [Elusimicrobiota bacterium]